MQDIKYTKDHEWVVYIDEKTARVGISEYAQAELGDLVFVNLPEVGDEVSVGEVFADVESVKAVSDIYSPLTGTVTAVNEALIDSPELINEDALEAWFIEVGDITDEEELLSEEEYAAFTEGEA